MEGAPTTRLSAGGRLHARAARFESEGALVQRRRAKTTLWFAPNKKVKSQDVGPNFVFARKFIENARSGILFLMFNPGPANSLLNAILERTGHAEQ